MPRKSSVAITFENHSRESSALRIGIEIRQRETTERIGVANQHGWISNSAKNRVKTPGRRLVLVQHVPDLRGAEMRWSARGLDANPDQVISWHRKPLHKRNLWGKPGPTVPGLALTTYGCRKARKRACEQTRSPTQHPFLACFDASLSYSKQTLRPSFPTASVQQKERTSNF